MIRKKPLKGNNLNVNNQQQLQLVDYLLRLGQACLTFDFIGTCQDESADDQTTVQIPTNWRSLFTEEDTLQLFFDLYKGKMTKI